MKAKPYLLTAVVVITAAIAVFLKYHDRIANPWTRNGHVRASVVKIAARVSGPIVDLPIQDNQFVRAGDLLFEIDPRIYEVQLEQARGQLAATGNNYQALVEQVASAEASLEVSRLAVRQAKAGLKSLDSQIAVNRADLERQQHLLPQKATSERSVQMAQANYDVSLEQKIAGEASLEQARAAVAQSEAQVAKARASLGALGDDNPQIRVALAAVRQAELNLEFTRVTAPVDGYVTHLQLRPGSQAVANQPVLALIDSDSYWVHGYFRENRIGAMQAGDRAVVTLSTYAVHPMSYYGRGAVSERSHGSMIPSPTAAR